MSAEATGGTGPGESVDEVSALRHELAEAREQLDATGEILRAMGTSSDLEAVLGLSWRVPGGCAAPIQPRSTCSRTGTFRVAAATGVSDDVPRLRGAAPDGRRPGDARRAGRPRPAGAADPRRPRRPRVRAARRPARRRLPHHPRRARCWSRTRSSACCRCGARRSTRSATVPSSWSPRSPPRRRSPSATSTWCRRCRLAPTSSPTKVEQLEALRRDRPGGQLQPRPRRGPRPRSSPTPCSCPTPTADHCSSTTTDQRDFRIRAAFGTSPELLERPAGTRITLDDTLVGRACRRRAAAAGAGPGRGSSSTRTCARCTTPAGDRCSPCRCCTRTDIVGALVVRRRTPGGFSEDTCELLQTFASQSALAIVNARLFRRARTASRASCRSPAGTSRSSWRACRTSCARRSTR